MACISPGQAPTKFYHAVTRDLHFAIAVGRRVLTAVQVGNLLKGVQWPPHVQCAYLLSLVKGLGIFVSF